MHNENEDLDKIRPEIIQAAYKTRLTHLRRAQEHSGKGEVSKSVEHYLTYLKALSMYFRITEDKLTPKLFDEKKEITELLLISHVYWDLAKAYDRNPKTIGEAKRCLNQFAKFTIGFKYQRVNADIVRKYLRKRLARNPEVFKESYERIKVTSKACYIATHCYGENDYRLTILRSFKDDLINYKIGRKFVCLYYDISPKYISIIKKLPFIDNLIQLILIKPVLEAFVCGIKKYRKK